jgi:hypothetical protein
MANLELKQLPIVRRFPNGTILGRMYNERNELIKLRMKQAGRVFWINL